MSNETNSERGQWVPALVLESPTTPQQRERNYAFYVRIRDGVEGDYRQSGLKSFVFEVPASSCTVGGKPPHFTFRLDRCDADDEVERLNGLARQFHADMWSAERRRDDACSEVERLRALVFKACSMGDDAAFARKDCDEFMAGFDEIRQAAKRTP